MSIELYDATLRDGMGGSGMSLTVDEKLRVVRHLDALGVHVIEAGFPASNPKEAEFFAALEGEGLAQAQIAAFGMTRRRDCAAADDEYLRLLADSFAPVCTIVGKASLRQAEDVVRVTGEENLALIADSVAFLVAAGKRVVFDAEHFFDGFRDDADYALRCVEAARGAGASTVALCDTNGGSLPWDIEEACARVGGVFGIHCHNDSGCGVANTLAGVRAGATQVQGTINGVGERTGNANLVTVIADLQLKMGHEVLPPDKLSRLTEVGHLVDELLNRVPDPQQPYVGKHAFAHKAGLHAAGIRKDASLFEHVEPGVVGNRQDVLVSELAGRATVLQKAEAAGIDVDPDRVVERVKQLEHEGYQFEAADGSFELLMRKEAGVYEPLFRLESWRVIVEKRADGKVETEATLKLWADGERYVHTAEGNGPVHALDRALRGAIQTVHPHLADLELVNFKVRILDETKGSDAVIRVLVDVSDGHDSWGSIGVSTNLIEASWQALVDALEHAMQPARVP